MQILASPHAGGINISGGQETVTVGGYKYVVFTSSGTLTVSGAGTVSLCTVGGGAGGGSNIAGGGGGGELDLFADFVVASNLTITVGANGTGGVNLTSRGTNGGTSTVVEGATTHQSALGGGGGGTFRSAAGISTGAAGGSGGGGEGNKPSVGGAASGSNTFTGGDGITGAVYYGGGGGGATAVGSSSVGTGGQGYLLSSVDTNLTAANFPTTLTGITHLSSGGGGGQFFGSGVPAGGTNAGSGGREAVVNPTDATGYGCGGGGSGDTPNGALGFAGLVICRIVA